MKPQDGTVAEYQRARGYPPPRTAVNNAGREVWELYNVDADPTELNNLATKNPEKLAELKTLFDREAKANNAYPLINWSDLMPGFMAFQRKLGLSPPPAAPKN